jgi:hypothetical protein
MRVGGCQLFTLCGTCAADSNSKMDFFRAHCESGECAILVTGEMTDTTSRMLLQIWHKRTPGSADSLSAAHASVFQNASASLAHTILCVLILLYVSSYYYSASLAHTTIYVSSCHYTCVLPHTHTRPAGSRGGRISRCACQSGKRSGHHSCGHWR